MHIMGFHWLLDLWGVPTETLDDGVALQNLLVAIADQSGATVIDTRFSRFEPHGVSGIVIIAESHITLHSWPELGYAAIDVFTCGNTDIGESICQKIVSVLSPSDHKITRIRRGIPSTAEFIKKAESE